MIILVLAFLAALRHPWQVLEEHAVMRAAGVTRRDVDRGYVMLVRNLDGVLVVRPGPRSVAR